MQHFSEQTGRPSPPFQNCIPAPCMAHFLKLSPLPSHASALLQEECAKLNVPPPQAQHSHLHVFCPLLLLPGTRAPQASTRSLLQAPLVHAVSGQPNPNRPAASSCFLCAAAGYTADRCIWSLPARLPELGCQPPRNRAWLRSCAVLCPGAQNTACRMVATQETFAGWIHNALQD